MKRFNLYLILLISIVFLQFSCNNNVFFLQVLDANGNFYVKDAQVQVLKDGKVKAQGLTNGLGYFVLNGLSTGQYQVIVTKDGYQQIDTSVNIVDDKGKTNIYVHPLTRPVGGVMSVYVTGHTTNSATFDVKFYFADSHGNLVENLQSSQVQINNTTIDGANYNFTQTGFSTENYPSKRYFDAVLAFDASADVAQKDPNQSRIIGGKWFLANLNGNYAKVIGYAYRDDWSYLTTNSDFSGGDFISGFIKDGIALFSRLQSLDNNNVKGLRPFYYAAYEAVTSFYEMPHRRIVVLFTSGTDNINDDTSYLDYAVERATGYDRVWINTIGLGNDVKLSELAKLSYSTGGFAVKTNDPAQVVTAYGALIKLFDKGGLIYKASWTVNVSNNVFPGAFETTMNIIWNGNVYEIPIYVEVAD